MLRWQSCVGPSAQRNWRQVLHCCARSGRFPVTVASFLHPVPAPEQGLAYSFSLADGDWFYFAGVWRPATRDWPEVYAILMIQANDDMAPFHDRQMTVLRRDQRMAWLDRTCLEEELLRPLPSGTFAQSMWTGDARINFVISPAIRRCHCDRG